jgi:hypothetical protein
LFLVEEKKSESSDPNESERGFSAYLHLEGRSTFNGSATTLPSCSELASLDRRLLTEKRSISARRVKDGDPSGKRLHILSWGNGRVFSAILQYSTVHSNNQGRQTAIREMVPPSEITTLP